MVPPEGRGTSLLDPYRLFVGPCPKEGVVTTHDLWRRRNIDLQGMWFYLLDNGDLKQFWAHSAEQLETPYKAGKRRCTLVEPRWLGPQDPVGWRTIVHTIDFDKATMTNEVYDITRTILRLVQGSPDQDS